MLEIDDEYTARLRSTNSKMFGARLQWLHELLIYIVLGRVSKRSSERGTGTVHVGLRRRSLDMPNERRGSYQTVWGRNRMCVQDRIEPITKA